MVNYYQKMFSQLLLTTQKVKDLLKNLENV